MLRKILVTLVVLVVVIVAALALFIAARQNLKFNPPYPAVAASADSSVIARGHYIVRSVSDCAGCHGDTKQADASMAGAEVPLCGGFEFNIPPGKFYPRNLTSDAETGLGNVPAEAIARALRYGVGHDGRALLPFMEFQNLSDEDLVAVVSYLKTQPPVHHPVPANQYTLLGKIIRATVLANPVGPKETPLKRNPHGATVENGRYLVESAALCWSCHTQRDPKTGSFTGPRFGGATGFDGGDPKVTWSPPNITSDAKTGRLARFTEDEFVARIRTGRLLPGSPMPWQALRNLDQDDIRAIYRYLKTIPPVEREVGPPMVAVTH